MRNNREPIILIILIVFLLLKNNQPDSSSYRFSAELNNWKRYNYPREEKGAPFVVVQRKDEPKNVRNSFHRVFEQPNEDNKENNDQERSQSTRIVTVVARDSLHLKDCIFIVARKACERL